MTANKKVFEFTNDELVKEYENAIVESFKIQAFSIRKSIKKAYQWEQALMAELLKRLNKENLT